MRSVVALILLSGCAYPLPESQPGKDVSRWTGTVDWDAAGNEAAQVLAAYLAIDNSNPPGNETAGAEYLRDILAREGIESAIFEVAPGRGSLIARLRGSGGPPLCLLSHIDVAPADPSEWPEATGPFSGVIDEDGMIWGRGALDMKGMGALELMTMVWLKRLDVPLARDVVLIAVADEEVGNTGMKHVVAHHWPGCAHVVNEGGLGVHDALFEGQTLVPISVAEKGVLWLRMTARGEAGHGSTPRVEHAPGLLLDALERIRERELDIEIHPSIREFLAAAGDNGGGVTGFVLKRPTLTDWLATGRLMENPATRAAVLDTVNITGLHAGKHSPNVVDAEAHAILDCRLLPGVTAEEMIARLEELVGEHVRFEVLHFAPASESPWDDDFYRALARHAVDGRENVVAGPVLSVGFTDSMYAREQGARAYGLVPFDVPKEHLLTMHGPKERVSVENVRRGLRALLRSVLEVSTP